MALEIEEDIAFQEKLGRLKRPGIALLIGLVIFGALGLTGADGFFAIKEIETQNLTVKAHRFGRWSTEMDLELQVKASSLKPSFWINKDLLSRADIKHINPEPSSSWTDKDKIYYDFNAASDKETLLAVLTLRPNKPGMLPIQVGSASDTIEANAFVWP